LRAIVITSLILAGVFILQSCQPKVKHPVQKPQKLTVENLRKLVSEGLDGSKTAKDSLSGLFDLSEGAGKYNNLEVNEINLNDGRNDFYVLLEYPNPLYNKLAFYGEDLKCFLIDRSLTGNIKVRPFQNNGQNYIEVNEGFRAKDIYQLNRTSFYMLTDTSAALVFRTFTKIVDPYLNYSQKIIAFTLDTIRTEINSIRHDYQIKHDDFIYDPRSKEYKSSVNMFDSLVKFILNQSTHKVTGKVLSSNSSSVH